MEKTPVKSYKGRPLENLLDDLEEDRREVQVLKNKKAALALRRESESMTENEDVTRDITARDVQVEYELESKVINEKLAKATDHKMMI